MRNDLPSGQPVNGNEDEASERLNFIVGFVLAMILTIISFGLVAMKLLPPASMLATLGVLAIIQIAVHLRCFLHIDHEKSHRDDLRLVILTAIMIAIVVGGTIWILWDQHLRMMA